MGKEKQHRGDAPVGAFTRMNYLYQAAHLMAKTSLNKSLCNYYNKLMKDISKKVVEKLHPDLKRTVCLACNYSLTGEGNKIKVKSSKRKKRKVSKKDSLKKYKTSENSSSYKKCRVEIRNKKPNKIKVNCCKCGFSKSYLLRPSYQLWIHKTQNNQ